MIKPFQKTEKVCCTTQFCNRPIFFTFKYNYLQLNTSLTEKSTIFSRIFTFPQTISLSNTKKSVMRGHAFIGLALRNIPRNHGGIAYPPNPRRSFGRSIQREITNDPYIRAGAYAPLHGLAQTPSRPQTPGGFAHLRQGFCGTFPLGLPECIRQTPLPCVRGPDRASRLRRGAVG